MDVTSAIGNKQMKTDSKTSNVLIKINGENKLIPQNTSILKLLEIFKLKQEGVVIELNKEIVKKEQLKTTYLKKDDELEIITFVQGG